MTESRLPLMRCPECGREEEPDSIVCEQDGTLLVHGRATVYRDRPESSACPECGAGPEKRDADGYCRCGADRRYPRVDRIEIDYGADLAGVSDRGSIWHHHVNQDAIWMTRGEANDKPYYVAVLADGVSHAYRSQLASATVVSRTGVGTVQAIMAGRIDVPNILRDVVLDSALGVRALPYNPDARADDGSRYQTPATTLVVAVLWGDALTLANIGDSRGYVGSPGNMGQCTRDDSWLQKLLDQGTPMGDALQDSKAHALTRWVGLYQPDAPDIPPFEPSIVTLRLAPDSAIVLVSDGVWGYAPAIADFNALTRSTSYGPETALTIARRLVDNAVAHDGGEDNASAVVIRPDVSR